MDITGITVLVKGEKPVLFRLKSKMTVQVAIERIRDKYGLVGGSITANGIACVHQRPLRAYQGEDLLFDRFESAAKEGKSTFYLFA